MTDCCEDKTSPYDIRPGDTDIIRAAIELGEKLDMFEGVTSEQHVAISKMLSFLRNLPAPPPDGLHGEFGFRFEDQDEAIDQGHYGAWCVSVCRAAFEIFNCGRSDLPEFEWFLCPGHKNLNPMEHAASWIAQVSDPMALLLPGQRLVIDASTWSIKVA